MVSVLVKEFLQERSCR